MPPVAKKAVPKVADNPDQPPKDVPPEAGTGAENLGEGAGSPLAGDDESPDGGALPDLPGEAEPERLISVADPCPKHFPDGWPAQEPGAHVNCPCGHAISFGQKVDLTVARAVELGFIKE